MHILIAPDKFKGSLDSRQVCEAIQSGIRDFDPSIAMTLLPVADGGEGSLDMIAMYRDVQEISLLVKGPLGRTIESNYLLAGDKAYIEMARASGLMLLREDERNPLYTTSYGTGELMMDATKMGARHVYLFVGGSATNDMGIGMAGVFGYRFLDKDDEDVPPVGVSLPFIVKIESDLNDELADTQFYAVCDVRNKLFGKKGAAYVYAAQKGANVEEIQLLDKGLKKLSKRCKQFLGKDISKIPGSGAAGGIAGGLLAFLDGEIISGTDFMLSLASFQEHVKKADLVITGEGKMDKQTLEGKVVKGVAEQARKQGIPVWAIAGMSDLSSRQLRKLNIQKMECIMDHASNQEDAITNAKHHLRRIIFQMLSE